MTTTQIPSSTTTATTITTTLIKIVLSTRFSINPSSHSEATQFTKILKEHEYIRGISRGKYSIKYRGGDGDGNGDHIKFVV